MFLYRYIKANRGDGKTAVLRSHHSSQIVNPDIRTVLFLHPVFHHIPVILSDLGLDLFIDSPPVSRMHTVGHQSADIFDKLLLTFVAEIV